MDMLKRLISDCCGDVAQKRISILLNRVKKNVAFLATIFLLRQDILILPVN